MQSALSGCNWPCQNCFSQTVSSSRLSQAAARSLVQEMQLAKGGRKDESRVKGGIYTREARLKEEKRGGKNGLLVFSLGSLHKCTVFINSFKPLFYSVLLLLSLCAFFSVCIRPTSVCVCVFALHHHYFARSPRTPVCHNHTCSALA